MLAAALVFAVLDGLIKMMGPAFRVWDIAFLRWGGSLVLLDTWHSNTNQFHFSSTDCRQIKGKGLA
jgi:hypothetical protein